MLYFSLLFHIPKIYFGNIISLATSSQKMHIVALKENQNEK